MRILPFLVVFVLGGCAGIPEPEPTWQPSIGSNDVFNTEPGAAPGHRLVVADLKLGPDSVGATHFHPWEEYLYIIEGSAVLEIAGEEPRQLVAGDKAVIPARAVHTPKSGPDGVRAIVTRVHDLADPIRVLVE